AFPCISTGIFDKGSSGLCSPDKGAVSGGARLSHAVMTTEPRNGEHMMRDEGDPHTAERNLQPSALIGRSTIARDGEGFR
ncbi:hypothetical protein NHX12_022837, partial [Muraenolepis orangiensis]